MRLPDGSAERGALDERSETGQARGASDVLRQRLDRLAACHPSSPDYGELEHGGRRESGEMERRGPADSGGTAYGNRESEAPGTAADRAADEQDRQVGRPGSRPGSRRGEQAGRDEKTVGRPGAGDRTGWRAGDAGAPDGGGAGGLGGGPESYRPWFTAGESPEPWFTAESGG